MTMFSAAHEWLFSSVGGLRQRATRAGAWLLIGEGAGRLASFLKLVVLARLLSPSDFGVMGIALLVSGWLDYFTDVGLNAALIQRRGDIRPYLNTAWTIQVARGLVLAAVLLAGAPLVGWFFDNSMAVVIVQVLAFDAVIWAFVNPAVVYLRRDLAARTEVAWRLVGVAAGLVAGVVAAYTLRNVWALVISVLAASFTTIVASYIVYPYRPALSFEWGRAAELMRFGRWILSLRTIGFLNGHADSFVVGKVLGIASLGVYQLSHQFVVQPMSTLGMHAHGVLFPALSSMARHEDRQNGCVKALTLVLSVVIPAASFVTVFGDVLAALVLGPKWAATAPLLKILVWLGALRAVSVVMSAFFLAQGSPRLDVLAALPKLALLVVFAYPLALTLGVVGVAVTVVGGSAVVVVVQSWLLVRTAGFSVWQLVKPGGWGVAAAAPFLVFEPLVPVDVVPAVGMAAVMTLFSAAVVLWSIAPFFWPQAHRRLQRRVG